VDDDYAWLERKTYRAPNPPVDMSRVWDTYDPVEGSSDRDRDVIRRYAASKGFGTGELVKMGVRYHTSKSGEVWLAFGVRCDANDDLEDGTVVGVKLRSCQQGRKISEPGSRIAYPARPSMFPNDNTGTIYVCEGESDAAWLLAHSKAADQVYCLHGGASVWDSRWADPLRAAVEGGTQQVLVATDNDWDRPVDQLGIQNIGEHLAGRILADVPGARRLRPPMPARDWCEVVS
jgi:hypothetical protein